jgi:hypothetical protein
MQTKPQHTKKLMYLKRLQPFLNAMEQYSTVINIFVNTSNLVAFVWVGTSQLALSATDCPQGPMKFLLVVSYSLPGSTPL